MRLNRFTFLASAIALMVSISPIVTTLGKANINLADDIKIENININRRLKEHFAKFKNIETQRSDGDLLNILIILFGQVSIGNPSAIIIIIGCGLILVMLVIISFASI